MATLVVFATSLDNEGTVGVNAVYATAREVGSSGAGFSDHNIGQAVSGSYFVTQRKLEFDTSSIGVGAVVTQARLFVYFVTTTPPTIVINVEARAHVFTDPFSISDFVPGSQLSAKTLLCSFNSNGLGVSKYYEFLENALAANINLASPTQMMLTGDNQRLATIPVATTETVLTAWSDPAGSDRTAKLIVTYTSALASLGGGPLSTFRPMQSTPSLVSP